MDLKEIRTILLKHDKTMVWLASKLCYSSAYLYKVIKMQKDSDIELIKMILEDL